MTTPTPDPTSQRPATHRWSITVLLVLTALAWGSHWQRISLKEINQAAFNGLRYQLILAGISVDLERASRVIKGTSSIGERPTVVVVVSDECPYCHEDVPLWKRLVGAMPRDTGLEIVAKRGEVIAADLFAAAARRGLHVAVRVPAGTTQFNVSTGWRGTPATVLLARDQTIALFVARMTEESLTQILAELSGRDSLASRETAMGPDRSVGTTTQGDSND